MKKNDNEDFDVPMGWYDSAEVCELVGALLLNGLKHVCSTDKIALYRDDDLGIIQTASGP